MSDPRVESLRSTADVTERIVVKGIVDPEKLPRVVVKGASDAARVLMSGHRPGLDVASAYAKAARLNIPLMTTERALQYVAANAARMADFQTTSERVLRAIGTVGAAGVVDAVTHARSVMDHAGVAGVAAALDVINKADIANKAALGMLSTEAKLLQTDFGCSRIIDAVTVIGSNAVQRAYEAFRATDWAMHDAVSRLTTNNLAEVFLAQQRAERAAFATLMSPSYLQDVARISGSFDFSRITAQIAATYDAITAAFRISTERYYTDPIVDDMLILVDPDVSDAERDAALDRVAMWFVQQRLSYRTRTIVRRLNQATLQATILLVINGEEFSRLGPWDAKDEMPKLVLANLAERPTTKTWNGAPIYRVSGRKARTSDADLQPYQPHQIYQAQPQLDALIAEWGAGDLRRVIERSNLTRDERRLVELLLNEGLTIRAAAKELGIDEKAAMMRRKRAQGKLKATRERDQKQQQRARRRRNT